MRRRLDRLGDLSLPHYSQFVLAVVLLVAVDLAMQTGSRVEGPRRGAVSVLGFLPAGVLADPVWPAVCRWTLAVAAVLWLLQLLVPLSSWLAVAAFTAAGAFYEENLDYVDHVHHLTHGVLFLHALWYHFYRREIRDALGRGAFWTTPLAPAWLPAGALFLVGTFYTWGGITKLVYSGRAWASGVPMQLWAHLWGREGYFLRDWIVGHRWIARAGQISILTVETFAWLAWFDRRLRIAIGLVLVVGFHLVIEQMFGFLFHGNASGVALVLLPVREGVEGLIARARAKAGPPRRVRLPGGVAGRLRRAVLARTDLLGRFDLEVPG